MKNFLILLSIFFFGTGLSAQEKPNILWISVEDISPNLSFYGDNTAETPNLDSLAKKSLIYDNAFTTVGVCAPSRSSLITGMQPISIGTIHMRTARDAQGWGKRKYREDIGRKDIEGNKISEYSAVVPLGVKCFSEYLRAEGYYCTNNKKTDYQFAAPISAWDENSSKAHWRNREKRQPFFSVFNIEDTHESKLWKYEDKPLTVKPENVPVPPYFPDTPATRESIARHYSNIEIMDKKVGEIIHQLKKDGLYDNTIIVFFSDHGGPLPRQKRAIYDSGLRVPLLIKYPGNRNAGRTDRLISFVDMAPTMLSLAGIKPPDYIQGKAFAGSFDTDPREYIIASSDRFDEITDRIRAVRTKDYLYLHNFYPEKSGYKNISYRMNIPMMEPMLKMRNNGSLDSIQMQWFQKKQAEELYEVHKDPYNIHNIANKKSQEEELKKMREILRNFLLENPDLGQMPEAKLILLMWPGNKQPETKKPVFERKGNKIQISTGTPGSSIVYMITDDKNIDVGLDGNWKLYTEPISILKGKSIFARAERIGFTTSRVVVFENQK